MLYNAWSGNKGRPYSALRFALHLPQLLQFSAAQLRQMQQWFLVVGTPFGPLVPTTAGIAAGQPLPLLADIIAFRYGTGCVARCIVQCFARTVHLAYLKCARIQALSYIQTCIHAYVSDAPFVRCKLHFNCSEDTLCCSGRGTLRKLVFCSLYAFWFSNLILYSFRYNFCFECVCKRTSFAAARCLPFKSRPS